MKFNSLATIMPIANSGSQKYTARPPIKITFLVVIPGVNKSDIHHQDPSTKYRKWNVQVSNENRITSTIVYKNITTQIPIIGPKINDHIAYFPIVSQYLIAY